MSGAALALSSEAIEHLRELIEARAPICPESCKLCAEILHAVSV